MADYQAAEGNYVSAGDLEPGESRSQTLTITWPVSTTKTDYHIRVGRGERERLRYRCLGRLLHNPLIRIREGDESMSRSALVSVMASGLRPLLVAAPASSWFRRGRRRTTTPAPCRRRLHPSTSWISRTA